MKVVFKEYKVLTAPSAQLLGMNITAMLLSNRLWQLHGPTGCVQNGVTVEYYQAIVLHEIVQPVEAAPTPATPAPEGETSVQ